MFLVLVIIVLIAASTCNTKFNKGETVTVEMKEWGQHLESPQNPYSSQETRQKTQQNDMWVVQVKFKLYVT